jgi:hypothetical protein
MLIACLQDDGFTGRVPSWLIKQRYPEYAFNSEIQALDALDDVLQALHEILGKNGKGKWRMQAEDGREKRLIGYVISESDKGGDVVKGPADQASRHRRGPGRNVARN